LKQFCSHAFAIVNKRPASQAVCRGFDSLRPLQFLEQTGGDWASIVRREINCCSEKIAFFGFVLPNCGFCSYNPSAWHSAGNGNAASIHS
jgi:hypothetical protein